MADKVQFEQLQSGQTAPTTADLIEHLSCFEGAPNEFLFNLLAVQCQLASAVCGAVIRPKPNGQVEIPAAFPPLPKDAPAPPVWLAQAVESGKSVLKSGTTAVKPLHQTDDLYGQPPSRYLVILPIKRLQKVEGLAAFVLENTDQAAIDAGREKLELTASLLSLYEMRLLLQKRGVDLERLQRAMGVLSAINTQQRFTGAAMALCNEVTTRWGCDRVGFGILKGRYVHLKAMSHTEKFSRKMKLVQEVEGAMEECLDQDIEILYPSPPDATYVSRSAADLSKHHGPNAITSLPLRQSGEPVAVLTIERPTEKPVQPEELETLRLVSDLTIARLMNLYERDRWFGAKIARAMRKTCAAVIGPKHTWLKIAAMLILGLAAFLIFAKGDYRAEAPFTLEPTQRRVVPAPFDGFLKTVFVEPDKAVVGGETVLAELDDADLQLKLLEAQKEYLGYETVEKAAWQDNETGEAQKAKAQGEQVMAKIALLKHHIEKARIVAPISGVVIVGDLMRQIGAPVKTGDLLFEIAPLESLRAELSVPEDEIVEVKVGQEGELAVATYPEPEWRVRFVVEKIFPIAEISDQKNVFKVRVRLFARHPWMRPGMEGLAKIDIGRRPYAWLWTRKLVNWIRMKLWI